MTSDVIRLGYEDDAGDRHEVPALDGRFLTRRVARARSPAASPACTASAGRCRSTGTASTAPSMTARIAGCAPATRRTRSASARPTPRLSWIVESDDPDWRQSGYEVRAIDPDDRCASTQRARRVERLGVRAWPLRAAALSRSSTGHRASGRDRRRTSDVERTARPRGRAARPQRLAGRAGDAPSIAGAPPERPIRFRRGFAVRGGLVARPALRIGARHLHRRVQRRAGRRPRARPGVDELPPPPALPDVRRHRPPARRRQRDRDDRRRGLVPRPHRIRRRAPRGLRPATSDRSPSSSCTTPTAAPTWSRPTANWRAASGPYVAASLYDGESYDARLADPAWTTRRLRRPRLGRGRGVALGRRRARRAERSARAARSSGSARWRSPPRRAVRRSSTSARTSPVGSASPCRASPAGEIVLRHAEVLEHGELGVRPLRKAAATDEYTLAGDGIEVYEPAFTIHGFRYAEVSGWPDELTSRRRRGSRLPLRHGATGTFHCSHAGLQRLHENVRWSMRGNFVDLPTDCPQRDERLGWTGDIQVFAPTASFLYDCNGFLSSWLEDFAAEQRALRLGAGVRAPRRVAVPGRAGRRVGRRGGDRAVGAVRAVRRRRRARPPVRQHAGLGRPGRRARR